MAWLDMVPVVSQVKSLTHLAVGDKEGAKRTFDRYFTKTPVMSHLHAGLLKVCGDDEKAKECWQGANQSMNALPVVGHAKGIGHYVCGDIKGGNTAIVAATKTTGNIVDSIPVAGHVKGVAHYAFNDKEGGNRAMLAASRTTTVMAAGAGGFMMGGPAGAVAGGVAAGCEWDLVTGIVTNCKQMNGICKIVENPTKVDSYLEAGISVVSDGLTGYSGGKVTERVTRASEIRTADNLRKIRQAKDLPKNKTAASGKNGREIFCEVKDTKTGKTYTGVNHSARKAYGDPAPIPNEYLTQNANIQQSLKRHPASCAEAQALHNVVTDSSRNGAPIHDTRINTVEYKPNGDIYTAPRCDNCMGYAKTVGRCNTDGIAHRVAGINEYGKRGGAALVTATVVTKGKRSTQ